MAGTYTQTGQTVFGDQRIYFYTVTNYTNDETLTIKGMNTIELVIPMVNAASASVGYTKSGNVITFKTAADSYDGFMMVIGK